MLFRGLILCIALVVAAMGVPRYAHGGAWTLEEGAQFLIGTVAYSFGSSEFDDQGDAVGRASPFEKLEGNLFYENGLRDGLTLTLTTGYTDKAFGPTADERHHGLLHSSVGLRQRIWRSDHSVASVSGSLRVPGAAAPDSPAAEGKAIWEADARALFGTGFSVLGRNAFTDLQLAYRLRERFDDEVRFDATIGGALCCGADVFIQSFNTFGLQSRDAHRREHKVQISTVRPVFDGWSLQSGGVFTVAGRNTLVERGVFISVWRKF